MIGVNDLLMKRPEIPTSEILLSGKTGSKYFIVQKKLEGKPAGKRILVNDDVVDVWFGEKGKIFIPQIQKILTQVHKIRCRDYGWPRLIKHEVRGQYKSWRGFFEENIPLWLRSASLGDKRLGIKRQTSTAFLKSVEKLAYNALKVIPRLEPVLVHGDSINPSNILVQGNKITGLLDWEWSIMGDPAWEFCDCGWWQYLNGKSLKVYFKEMKYSKAQIKNFLERARAYRILWILWGSHMHAKDKNTLLYRVLRKMLLKEIKKFGLV